MRVLFVALLLLAAPAAMAGTADDPEVTDPVNDHKLTGGQSDSQALVKSVDIIKGWVEAVTETDMELRLQASQQMRGGQVNGNPTTQYDYDFHFQANGRSFVAGATVVGPAPPAVTPRGVASAASIDPASDSTLVLIVPLESIGGLGPGDVVSGLYVASKVYANAVTLGTDRAPDSGAGREFVVPSSGPDIEIVEAAFPVELEHAFAAPTNATYVLEWTSPGGNLTATLAVNGTGTVTVEYAVGEDMVHNVTVQGTGHDEVLLAVAAGNATVMIRYTAFAGNLTLTVAPTPPASTDQDPVDDGTGSQDPGAGDGTGNQTADADDNGAPLPWIAPALALLVAVAVRRRD